ncbi:MAG: EamA family transporter [Clostridia bacterium]|nr:EamA family transporter [Clostridia bacterium]
MNDRNKAAIRMAVLAACLYGVSAPFSKILLIRIPPTLMAALLYLGAGTGMLVLRTLRQLGTPRRSEARLSRKDLPCTAAMVLLDILAPILLMLGLSLASAESTALLNNFEIVTTSLIALAVFNEAIGKRMWLAILLITAASILLSIETIGRFRLSTGSVLVLLAGICWGFENNCTRMLSMKDPLQIVMIKGLGSGFGALLIALAADDLRGGALYVVLALLLGSLSYGFSIFFYIRAQRELGAARTSAYYAVAPFVGVLVSWLLFRERITSQFLAALAVMAIGTWLAVSEKHVHTHRHAELGHEHMHNHQDGHHMHSHEPSVEGEHCHEHTHPELSHRHPHTPDLHHRHTHR